MNESPQAVQPIAIKPAVPPFDAARAREDFPAFAQQVHGRPLVFLDSAASAQKPRAVIEAVCHTYEEDYANVHRGVYWLSQRATEAFENARKTVARFINAREDREIVFVRGATEAINLVANSYGRHFLSEGDEVVVSAMEHHSNIVPWQILRDAIGIALRVAPINDAGELVMEEFERLLGARTKLVAITHVSNALGSIVPVREIVRLAHEAGARVLIDGAQAAPHLAIDVRDLDCDFYTFSGHKIYGPTGIGVLYAKAELLESMPPYQGGGDMILSVSFEKTDYNVIPYKFEAGTPNLAGAVGLGAAIEYVSALGLPQIGAHERDLLDYATGRLEGIPGLRLIGTAQKKASVISFTIEGVHPHDVGTILDYEGVAVRTGHHCAQPVMARFGVAATVRASFALYNGREDVDALIDGLGKVAEMFG
ncbi:MAG: cysteine desulfurase [Alphaproteobacteria bacterium]